jgi:hypothetical protein
MIIKELVTTEEYDSLVKSPLDKRHYPIFVNPTRSEIKELAKETNLVRFIAHNGLFYLFNGALLHAYVIKHLELPISPEPTIEVAFLGIAKASPAGTLEYYDSNQLKPKDVHKVPQLYPYIEKYLL